MRRRDALRAGAGLIGAGVLGGAASGRAAGHGAATDGAATETSGDGATGTAGDDDAGDGNGAGGYGPLGAVEVRGTREAVVSADGATAFLAVKDGYATVDVSDPSDPTPLAERRGPVDGSGSDPFRFAQDVAVSGDTMVVVGPAHPGMDGPHGVLVVDVSDPAEPVRRGFYGTEFPIHNCDLDGDVCYLTGNGPAGNPLVVVDVAALTELARWSLYELDESWSAVRSGLRTLHDVTVTDGVAALAYWDAGTYLLDVSDPASPAYLGRVPAGSVDELRDPPPREGVTPPGNHHYSLLAPGGDLLAVGRESWAVEYDGDVLGSPSGVDLYDVSDPSAPRRLSTIGPPPTADPTFGGTWTTAHNLDIRGETLYTSWYQGGVKRHDVSDPSTPVEESWWVAPGRTRFWTAVLAVPGEFFVAPSMGTRDGAPAGLWTFPDRGGFGGTPDALLSTTTPGGTTTGSGGSNGSNGSSESGGSSRSTATPTDSRTTGGTTSGTTTGGGSNGTETPSEAAAPGFGVAGALGALGAGAALALRRGRRR